MIAEVARLVARACLRLTCASAICPWRGTSILAWRAALPRQFALQWERSSAARWRCSEPAISGRVPMKLIPAPAYSIRLATPPSDDIAPLSEIMIGGMPFRRYLAYLSSGRRIKHRGFGTPGRHVRDRHIWRSGPDTIRHRAIPLLWRNSLDSFATSQGNICAAIPLRSERSRPTIQVFTQVSAIWQTTARHAAKNSAIASTSPRRHRQVVTRPGSTAPQDSLLDNWQSPENSDNWIVFVLCRYVTIHVATLIK